MKNPRINLKDFDKTTHKIIYYVNELEKEENESSERKKLIRSKIVSLKQELISEIDWQENGNGKKEK